VNVIAGDAALESWSPPIPLTAVLAVAAFFYVRGWLHLRAMFPKLISVRHITAFVSGLIAVWIAAGSSLAALDHELLSIHMVQHILLMAIAPALILVGAPALALMHGLPRRFGQAVAHFLRSVPVQRVAKIVARPVVCWLAATITVVGWHVPAVFGLGLRSHWWHEIQQISFFAAGLLFWLPVIQPWPMTSSWPRWSAPLYLFLATLPCDALSAFLTFCDRVVYPHYASASRPLQISALQDQEWAGVLMWVAITFIYMVPAAVITVRMLSPQTPASQSTEILPQPAPQPSLKATQIEAV